MGQIAGQIFFEQEALSEVDPRRQAAEIGFVGQNPDNQLVTDKVWHELAFGLENLGEAQAVIRRRVSETAAFFGMQTWFEREVSTLSGGQKQLLNLASVVVMQPKVLLLDEPTAQLDPIASTEFMQMIDKIHRELGTTIIMVEHALEGVLALANRLVILEKGQVVANAHPQNVGQQFQKCPTPFLAALPVTMQLYAQLGGEEVCPLTVEEGQRWLEKIARQRPWQQMETDREVRQQEAALAMQVQEVWFRYDREQPDILRGLSLAVRKGEWYALVGGNGTGKSTLLMALAGILAPYRGEIVKDASLKLALLPQDPQLLFSCKTLQLELAESLADSGLGQAEQAQAISEVSRLCELETLLARHPYDLSGGEQQRLALAKVLLTQPDVLLLDEPGKGVDAQFKAKMGQLLKKLQRQGLTIVMVSHDLTFCAEYADRCGLFFNGQLACEEAVRDFFAGNRFYTTEVNRLARPILPQAIVVSDVLAAFGQTARPLENSSLLTVSADWSEKTAMCSSASEASEKKRPSRRQWLIELVVLLLVMPLTIWAGMDYFGDRRYNLIALLLIAEALLPFLLHFEHQRPKARELVILAVLCALGAAGRMAFFMVPQFKPVIALVVITGVALGAESGFLVGAMIGFVSNMFFGQGPWTPWQMFAFGLIGFLAGALAQIRLLRKETLPLCVFGGVSALVIYGGLLNPAAVLMFQDHPTKEMFLLAYLQGLPFDLIHAASTVFFLWLLAMPLLEKLERLKIKYALFADDGPSNGKRTASTKS